MIHVHFILVHLTKNTFLDLSHNASKSLNAAQMVQHCNINTSDTTSFIVEAFYWQNTTKFFCHSLKKPNGNTLSKLFVITSQL